MKKKDKKPCDKTTNRQRDKMEKYQYFNTTHNQYNRKKVTKYFSDVKCVAEGGIRLRTTLLGRRAAQSTLCTLA